MADGQVSFSGHCDLDLDKTHFSVKTTLLGHLSLIVTQFLFFNIFSKLSSVGQTGWILVRLGVSFGSKLFAKDITKLPVEC